MTPPPNPRDGYPETRFPLGHVEEWESSAIDYLEARLPLRETSAIDDHLVACQSCREKLAEQKRMILFLGAVESVHVPGELESRVFDRLFPVSPPLSRTRSTEPGVLRRLLTGAARRPWVPAAIAAVVVMVALAGAGDFIRPGGGTDMAGVAVSTSTQSGALRSASPSAGASLESAESRDAAGNAIVPFDLPGSGTTTPGAIHDSPPQTDTGDPGLTQTTVTTTTAGIAELSGADSSGSGPMVGAALYAVPTIWVSVEVAVGDINASSRIEEITGLTPLAMRTAPSVPIYAAKIRPDSIDAILRQLSTAGLAVRLSETPQAPLDPASALEARDISALPFLEPVSPQGDTLSGSIPTRAMDSETDYVLIVLSAVR